MGWAGSFGPDSRPPVAGACQHRVCIFLVFARGVSVGAGFGQPGTGPMGLQIQTRRPMVRWLEKDLLVIKGKGTIAEGWTLSSHHQLSPMEPSVLLKGDGTIARNTVKAVDTIAGTGEQRSGGDGGSAKEAQVRWPDSVASDRRGIFTYRIANGSERSPLMVKSKPLSASRLVQPLH